MPPAQPPHKPTKPALRRRIPLELTEQELDLLEAAETVHGTKRATLVAGLIALSQRAELEDQLDQAVQAHAASESMASELAERVSELEVAAAKVTAAKAAKDTSAQREQARARVAAEQRARELSLALDDERDRVEQLEAGLDELAELRVDSLHCRRCRTWVRPDGWAIHRGNDGDYLYHQACGLHEGGLTSDTSILGFRDR